MSVTPFPETSPENHLGLVEGSCGKVTHDFKLLGGSLSSVYLFLEANRRRVESAVAWAGASPVSILPRGALSKEEISPRECQKMP